jgi:MFS family permease
MTGLRLLCFLAGSFGVGVFVAFNNFTLPLWLAGFTSSYVLISLLGNSKSLEGAIVAPVIGAWSDRTWLGPLGRRRPFILTGGVAAGAIMATTPLLSRLTLPALGLPDAAARLAPTVAAVFLFTLAFGCVDDLQKALIGDLAVGDARNRLAALYVVAAIGGQAAVLAFGFVAWSSGIPDWAFALVGATVAAAAVVVALGVHEPTPDELAAHRTLEPHDDAVGLAAWARRYRSAMFLCLAVFAYWSGVDAVLPLVSIYVRDVLGGTVGEAQLLPGLLLLSTTAAAVPVARLGTRFGKQRVIAAGYLGMGLAALVGLVVVTLQQGVLIFLIAGLANAGPIVLTVPLLADLVPRQHLGKATGFVAASGSIAAPLSSLVGGYLSDLYGPRAIFVVMAVMVCVAVAFLSRVRVPDTSEPPRPRAVHSPTTLSALRPDGGT